MHGTRPLAGRPGIRPVIWLCAALLAAVSPAASAGDQPNLLTDPFYFALGSFILQTDTEVRLDGKLGEGTEFDWETTFGKGDATRFRVDGFWRFADRHKVRMLWFNNSTRSTRTFERDIIWDDVVYPASARITGEFDFDIYELAYEYAFLRRERYELAGTIGVHYTQFALALEGAGRIEGEQVVSGKVRREGSVGAPLPVFGLRGLWNLTRNLWLDASAQYFALSIDQYSGSVSDVRVALLWQPKKWVGLGLGYNAFGVDVDIDTSDFKGSLNWTYDGPMVFYSIAF